MSTAPVTVFLLCFFIGFVQCRTEVLEPDPFVNLSSPAYAYLRTVVHYLRTNGTSDKCRTDVQFIQETAVAGDNEALKIFDAMGKPGSGILEGGSSFIGLYSECTSTKVSTTVTGKYCLSHLRLTDQSPLNNSEGSLLFTQMDIAICVPSSCHQAEIYDAVQAASLSLHPQFVATLDPCETSDKGLEDGAVGLGVFGSILILFIALALLATVLDLCGYHGSDKKSNTNVEGQLSGTRSSIDVQGSVKNNSSTETLCKSKTETKKFSFASILLSFSMAKNGSKILSSDQGEGSISALHGIRFLSMAWIITGHSFSFAQRWMFFRNPKIMSSAPGDFFAQGLSNGTFSVDTFFYLSGFLMAYTMLKKMEKMTGTFSFLGLYLHRYIRMTPVMMVVIGFSATIIRYLGSGPSWSNATLMYDAWCRRNWWINALYLHNFIRTDEMCMSHTWYSAIDMQFFLVAPFIIKFCYWNIYGAIGALSTLFIITSVCPLIYTLVFHLPPIPTPMRPLDIVNHYYSAVYIKPYCRMGPYLVGVALAYHMYRKNSSTHMSKKTLWIGWIIAILVNITVIFSMGRAYTVNPPSDIEAALYNAFSRTAWAVTIGWITITCASGQAGVIDRLLSLPMFVPLSKLTYVAYLIHPVLMAMFYGSRESVFDFSIYWLIYLALGNMVITYIVSFVLSLLFESPIINIEKLLSQR